MYPIGLGRYTQESNLKTSMILISNGIMLV
jgi:hypothetical protein